MKTQTVIMGGGCFWCTEAAFLLLPGVIRVTSGYAGGKTNNPTYEQVCGGFTGHAEVIEVEYDPEIVDLDKILELFFTVHDPTQVNGQGNDIGSEYRSILLYENNRQMEIFKGYIKKIQKKYTNKIVTEIKKLEKFHRAEEWQQNYFEKNLDQPYCRFIVAPKVGKAKKLIG